MSGLEEMVEVKRWEEPGYQPLILSNGWQVAILNYISPLAPDNLELMERHNKTDEVFVLVRGRAWLLLAPKGDEVGDIEIVEMEKHVVYSVLAGVWHGVVASEDACWIIVENRDTHLVDVERRSIPEEQRQRIKSRWIES